MALTGQYKKGLTVGGVAGYCLVTTATVRRWIKSGKLSASRLPSGHYRVSIADFRDFLEHYNMPIKKEFFKSESGKVSENYENRPGGN
ncbi:MAG: helix-turn-helix domain-containing protein [Chloroflexota bacterium]